MVINRKQISERQMKALTIVGQNNQIKKINAVTYKVHSQSQDIWFDVTHPYKSDGSWNMHMSRSSLQKSTMQTHSGSFNLKRITQQDSSNI